MYSVTENGLELHFIWFDSIAGMWGQWQRFGSCFVEVPCGPPVRVAKIRDCTCNRYCPQDHEPNCKGLSKKYRVCRHVRCI